MGIQIETTIYGTTIGRALLQNTEELSYALLEMSEEDPVIVGAEIIEYDPDGKASVIAKWLRALADAIEDEAL